ncbi:histidine phosphatase family protein [Liquorilactobacillus nagelii]|uniref:histidine phosphatase family protein n=1 Tax=Liquorilactobacillus nagelii TaxID=82688 RepID=UPI00070B695B|nr:histidine phosphatase family protein [Liquorilactobacillus nagelii]QYH55284.1 histidine phosphatase family protein [Liquorilactobacillus nagelii DSM 13675]
MKKIYFVRHGETYFNRLNRMQGWSDTPLTALGKTTAVNFGKKLIETAPNISKNIYCSDTGRASKTAAKIIEGLKNQNNHKFQIVSLSNLREQFYGSYEGVLKTKVYQDLGYQNLAKLLDALTPDQFQDQLAQKDPLGLAETSAQFWQRFLLGIEQIIEWENQPVVVICHSAILLTLMARFGTATESIVEPANLSLTTVDFENVYHPQILTYNKIL